MKAFRLNTVERLRGEEVETAGRELHTATTALEAAQARRVDLLQQLSDPVGATGVGLTTGPALELAGNYRQVLRELILLQDSEIAERKQALVEVRARWVTARSRLRAVEALHDRHRAAVRLAELRREQRELDELAGTRRPGLTLGDPLEAHTADPPHVVLDDPAHDPLRNLLHDRLLDDEVVTP